MKHLFEEKDTVVAIKVDLGNKKELIVAPIKGKPFSENAIPMEWKGYRIIIEAPIDTSEFGIEPPEDSGEYGFGGDWWRQ